MTWDNCDGCECTPCQQCDCRSLRWMLRAHTPVVKCPNGDCTTAGYNEVINVRIDGKATSPRPTVPRVLKRGSRSTRTYFLLVNHALCIIVPINTTFCFEVRSGKEGANKPEHEEAATTNGCFFLQETQQTVVCLSGQNQENSTLSTLDCTNVTLWCVSFSFFNLIIISQGEKVMCHTRD